MLGSASTQSDNNLYILKIKNKATDKETGKELPITPHAFQVTEKIGDKWVAQDKLIPQFVGDLTKITFDKGEWEGVEYDKIKLYFNDDKNKETYLLDTKTSRDFRSLANSILALDPKNLKDIKVRFYKKPGKDGKEYSNIGVFQGDSFVKGKYAWEDMPPIQKTKFKGNDLSDTTEIDAWTIGKLKEFVVQMAPAPKAAKPVAPKSQVVEDQEVPEGGDEDSIPF